MINGLKIKILVLIVEKILINFYTNNKNKMGVLNPQDKFIVWSLINFYEFSLGFLLGLVVNEISFKILPFNKNENILSTLLLVIVIGVLSINLTLYLREWVNNLPGLNKYNLKEMTNFSHPPPIALTFGFWITHKQLKARNKSVQKYIFKIIGSPADV